MPEDDAAADANSAPLPANRVRRDDLSDNFGYVERKLRYNRTQLWTRMKWTPGEDHYVALMAASKLGQKAIIALELALAFLVSAGVTVGLLALAFIWILHSNVQPDGIAAVSIASLIPVSGASFATMVLCGKVLAWRDGRRWFREQRETADMVRQASRKSTEDRIIARRLERGCAPKWLPTVFEVRH